MLKNIITLILFLLHLNIFSQWNEVNSKTRAGEPCHGCTEPDFPKIDLFNTKKNMGIPQNLPLGVGKRAYLTLAGITKAFKIKRLEEDLF